MEKTAILLWIVKVDFYGTSMKGYDFIIHGLFVDDMMHVPTCVGVQQENRRTLRIVAFSTLYYSTNTQKDFEITGGGLMETFLGMQVEQSGKTICLRLESLWMKARHLYRHCSVRLGNSFRPDLVWSWTRKTVDHFFHTYFLSIIYRETSISNKESFC